MVVTCAKNACFEILLLTFVVRFDGLLKPNETHAES